MKHWGCRRNKHTNEPSLTPSNRTENQGVAIETVNYEWTGRGRAGAVHVMDEMWFLHCRADVLRHPVNHEGGISGKLRDIFLDGILDPSDATYRHQLCMTAVSHTHTNTCTHTKIQTTYTCRHTHTCNAKDPPYLHKTENYTRRLVKMTIMITIMAKVMMNMKNIWAV